MSGGKGNKQAFYFGNRLNGDLANCRGSNTYGTDQKGDYKGRTTQVGDYEKMAPHPWGLCDMHSNVEQRCAGAGSFLYPAMNFMLADHGHNVRQLVQGQGQIAGVFAHHELIVVQLVQFALAQCHM